jgi:hypothetical protein
VLAKLPASKKDIRDKMVENVFEVGNGEVLSDLRRVL